MYVNAGLRISYEDEKHMLIKDIFLIYNLAFPTKYMEKTPQ
jgi:hypothetical protein